MASEINARWHAQHRLGSGAPLARRIRWHVAHAQACGCRPMPPSIRAAVEAQQGSRKPKPRRK